MPSVRHLPAVWTLQHVSPVPKTGPCWANGTGTCVHLHPDRPGYCNQCVADRLSTNPHSQGLILHQVSLTVTTTSSARQQSSKSTRRHLTVASNISRTHSLTLICTDVHFSVSQLSCAGAPAIEHPRCSIMLSNIGATFAKSLSLIIIASSAWFC